MKPGSLQSGTGGCLRDSRQGAGRTLPGEVWNEPAEADPVKVLWNSRDHFGEHRARMRYDVFRRHDLPLSSSHIESAIKQTSRRAKGGKRAWHLERADGMLAMRCVALGADCRWDDYLGGLREGRIVLPAAGRLHAHTAEGLPEDPEQDAAP